MLLVTRGYRECTIPSLWLLIEHFYRAKEINMNFEKNIGKKNRQGRALIGAFLIAISLINYREPLAYAGLAIGALFVLEAIFSFCLIHGIRGTKDMR